MRRPERALRKQTVLPRKHSFYTVDFGQLHALRLRKRRQNGRDTRCHHSLARTRRSHKQQIVHSGYRNLTRPLHQPLSVYLRKIGKHCGLCFFYIIFLCGVLLPRRILKKTHDLPDIFHTADKHPGNKRRLFSIRPRHNAAPDSAFLCLRHHREHAVNRLHHAV